MGNDWVRWHERYDDAASSLARRLTVVQGHLRLALAEAPGDGELRLASMCAGEGRDVLPVLAERGASRPVSEPATGHRPVHPGTGHDLAPRHERATSSLGRPVTAVLVELDPTLASRARAMVTNLGLTGVNVVDGDAGVTDPYLPVAPAHVILACGVFGNVTFDDVRRTVTTLPGLLAPGGIVIWTRGRGDDPDHDPALDVRDCFTGNGFTELAYTAPDDDNYRVGTHRLGTPPPGPPRPGVRMFAFA